MQTICKLEGAGGQKYGKFANVIYERPLKAFTILKFFKWGILETKSLSALNVMVSIPGFLNLKSVLRLL